MEKQLKEPAAPLIQGSLSHGARAGREPSGRQPSGRDAVGGERTTRTNANTLTPRTEWAKAGAMRRRPRSRARPGDGPFYPIRGRTYVVFSFTSLRREVNEIKPLTRTPVWSVSFANPSRRQSGCHSVYLYLCVCVVRCTLGNEPGGEGVVCSKQRPHWPSPHPHL